MELNDIRNRNFVYEGQVLALAASARAAPPVEAEVPVEVVASAPVPEPAADTEAAEPTSEREAEEIGPSLVPGTQAAESADPSDYSVRDDDTVLRAGGRDARSLRRVARRARERPAPA